MTATLTLAPCPLRCWLTGTLFALIVFNICWTGAIAYWRARAGDPGAVEMLFYLLVLPGALLAGALVTRARRANAAPAGRMPARDQTSQPTAPSIQILPLAIPDTAVRSPHGASLEEVADALAGKQARPALDATLVDKAGVPLKTARYPEAAHDALQTDLAAWLAASALPDDFSDAQRHALVLATGAAGELAGKAAGALLQAQQSALLLQRACPAFGTKIIQLDAAHLLAVVLPLAILVGCDLKKESQGVSESVGALQKIVELNTQPTSVQWEIFSSPEQTGLQVGPSDSTILIAELSPLDTKAFSLLPPGEETFYVPEAARPWLDKDFQSLFQKKVGRVVSLSTASTCRPFKAILKTTRKFASGFICKSDTKALVYLTIASDSMR